MSATKTEELLGALHAGCERLVHPSVADEAARGRHGRLLGILLASPLLLASATAVLFAPVFGTTATLALIGLVFTLAWSAAAMLALGGGRTAIEPVAMMIATLALSGIVAASGGLASPALLAVLALPFEASWLVRSRRAAQFGAIAALAVLPLQAVIGAFIAGGGAGISGWHWLVPLAYAAFAVPRAVAWVAEARREPVRSDVPALEDVIDAVTLRLAPTGDVIDASPPARRIICVAPELLLGNGLSDRIHVADRVGYLCALAALRQNAGRQRIEIRLRSPADGNGPGAYRPFALEMARGDDRGETVMAVLRNNEEMAGLVASLAAAREAAESVAVARNRTLAAVSHELRTPLNAIIGFSDMLLGEMFGPFRDPRQQEYVGLIAHSGRHLLAVASSMLDVTRLESGAYATSPERFRFPDAVEASVSMLASAAGARGIEVCREVEPGLRELNADRHAVQQMLINLLFQRHQVHAGRRPGDGRRQMCRRPPGLLGERYGDRHVWRRSRHDRQAVRADSERLYETLRRRRPRPFPGQRAGVAAPWQHGNRKPARQWYDGHHQPSPGRSGRGRGR